MPGLERIGSKQKLMKNIVIQKAQRMTPDQIIKRRKTTLITNALGQKQNRDEKRK